jgi:hypothetical protein
VYAAAITVLLTTLSWHSASAQGVVPCTAIENDTERLACYDRALRGTAPAPAAQPASAEPETRTAPARTAAPVAAPSPPAATVDAPRALATEPRRERRVRESTAPAAPAAPVAGLPTGEEIVPLVIVGVRALPGRDTMFTAKDGSSWVQTDSQRIMTLPDPPFDAELKAGAMGSFFLVPKEGARAIRVRPVR